MKIPVCFSIDDNFAEQLCVTMLSVIKNKNDDDELHFYIIDKNITKTNKEKISSLAGKYSCKAKFLKVNPEKFEHCPHVNEHVSLVSYYRVMLPDLIPDEDKLLYLDCDIIVRTGLSDIFKTNLTDNYAALVQDVNEEDHKKRLNLNKYCNSGVILFNANLWRKDNITEKVLDWVQYNNSIMVFQDQDAINGSLNNKIIYLDNKWNVQTSNLKCSRSTNREALSAGGGGLVSFTL